MTKVAEFIFIILLAVGAFGGYVSRSDNTDSTDIDAENFYTNEDYAPFEDLEQGYGYYASDSSYSVPTEYDYSQYNESEGYIFYAQDYKNYPLEEEMYDYEEYSNNR